MPRPAGGNRDFLLDLALRIRYTYCMNFTESPANITDFLAFLDMHSDLPSDIIARLYDQKDRYYKIKESA